MKLNDKIPKEEIDKWYEKLVKRLEKTKSKNDLGKEFLENVNAYKKDCIYFLEKGDYMRSFEAVVWAWAWLEIGEKIDIFEYIQ